MKLVGDSKSPLEITQGAAGQAKLEAAAKELVAFATGNPSLAEMQVQQQFLQTSVLKPIIEGIFRAIAPAFIASPPPKQRENWVEGEKLLSAMRANLAAKMDFQRARDKLGIGTGQLGGLLASACDSPVTVDVAWAVFRMSVLVDQASKPTMQNGQ